MTAYDVLAAGLAVLPIDPRTKRPPVTGSETYPEATEEHGYGWKPFQTNPPSEGVVRSFLRTYPDCWLGFACGHGSGGVEVLDFDVPGKKLLPVGTKGAAPAWDPWCEAVRAEGLGDALDRLTIVETPSGGRQAYYRCPNPAGNTALATRPASEEDLKANSKEKSAVLIETRGVGGLVVCPPSPGYRFLQGDFSTIPTLTDEERGALWAIAASLDETPPEPEREKPSGSRGSRPSGDVSPGDDYDARASWDEVLEPYGYRRAGKVYAGTQLWAHPSKPKGEYSARTGMGKTGDRFVSWSSNGGTPTNKALKKYATFAHLYHDGDFPEAIRALVARGFGSPAKAARKETQRPQGGPPEEDQRSELETTTKPEEKTFMRTDVGNARRLAHAHGDDLRFVSDWDRWLVWGGVCWEEDTRDGSNARAFVHRITDAMCESEDESLMKWGTRSQSSSAVTATLRESQVLLGIRPSDLDTHDHLLAFRNAVVDLRSGSVVESPRDLLITKQCNTYWDPEAKCPLFEDFLRKVTRERKGLVLALLRALGYSLTGETGAHKFFLMYGPRARNGKSTIQLLLDKILGDELCSTINKKLLTDSSRDSARFAVASLEGKRVVHANENSKGRTFDTEFLKEFSGGTRMQAERKGKDEYTIPIKAKLWLSVNDLPAADWTDAYASRVYPMPFEQSFYNPDNPLYREGDLPDLGKPYQDALLAEAPGIMALLVRLGSVPYYNEGGLLMPPEVKALLESYRTQSDYIGQWIEERCAPGGHDSHRITMGDAWKDFRDFLKTENIGWKGRINEFSNSLQNRPGLGHINPKNKSTITGIALRNAIRNAWDEENEREG